MVKVMIEWMIAHNMGILLMAAPFVAAAWIWVSVTEKIFKKH